MKTKRVLIGLILGIAVLVGGVWTLTKTLGNMEPTLYHGQTLAYWAEQVSAKDVAASNQANAILNAEIIPQLTNQMFHDTYDSALRMELIDTLNGLPHIWIYYLAAPSRRGMAATSLGDFGPASAAAVPALMQAVQGTDTWVHETAITSLGKIHSEPATVIPFLTKYLEDDNLNDEAATALSYYGSLAEPAVPKIIPLLHAADDDAQAAAIAALKKIDPAALTNAMKGTTNEAAKK